MMEPIEETELLFDAKTYRESFQASHEEHNLQIFSPAVSAFNPKKMDWRQSIDTGETRDQRGISKQRCSTCRDSKGMIRALALLEVFVVVISFGFLWFAFKGMTRPLTDHELVVATNAYSPLLTRRTMHLKDVTLKSSFLNKNNLPPSIFRQQPSDDVDAAWEYIHKNGRNFLITADEVRRLGKDPAAAVKAPDEWANGEEKYFALTQGQHDLHCLNMVRKFAFREHYSGSMNVSWGFEQHFRHCLHSLLQSLTCKYSTDVYLAAFLEGSDFPVVDFNVTRKCLNYDEDMNGWQPATQRTDAEFFGLRAPEDAVLQPMSIF